MGKIERVKELIETLNIASNDYYNSTPTMADNEWDKLYEELKSLEKETNIIYPNSPTQNVGYEIVDEIKKVVHNHPMLSLDKCHSEQELVNFAKDKNCILSVKCDGLTTSLHYVDGVLVGAESRGNGIEGGNVLHNVLKIKNIPHTIPYKEELIIDGETIIDWNTFNEINEKLPEGQEKYKHPRNLVSGSLNVLDTKVAASRNMRFIAWRVITGLNDKSVFFALKESEKLGFEIVPMWTYTNQSSDKENITAILSDLQDKADSLGIPYDGAVMSYDDIQYGESLGRTEKFFRHSIAYKYEDELYETILSDIEWQTSKTGLVNPVAIFDETLIDGSSITKATLHNISYIENLQLGIGDTIRIYKANKIIPKVHDNLTRSNTWKLPDKCPCCGGKVEIHNENGSKTLHCMNPECKAKLVAQLTHFCSRNAINIEGLSEQTLQKLVDLRWVRSFQDIMNLKNYADQMMKLNGFGKQSVNKLMNSIEKSKDTSLDRFLYALSIPLIGRSVSKDISKVCYGDINVFISMIKSNDLYKLVNSIDGFGDAMYGSLCAYCKEHMNNIEDLLQYFTIENEKTDKGITSNLLKNKVFVITGSLIHYKNRNELVNAITNFGGKVSGSVSTKTSFLINNDKQSSSSKNQKAQKLNIPIISENDFIKMIS